MSATTRRNALFGIAALIILFAMLELSLRLIAQLSTDYAANRDNINYEYKLWQMRLFDTFMGIQEPDPDLFWRMKPNYRSSFASTNSDGFSGPPIHPKEKGEFRILFLGDSTPLGLGLSNFSSSFVWQAESLLQAAFPSRHIVVINAAVAGYTSWQCRKLLELKGESLRPDLIITYFGNNDPSHNGYLTDRQLHETTRHLSALNRFLGKSYAYQILKGLVLRFKPRSTNAKAVQARVSVEDFRDNLLAVKRWCDKNQCRLLLCNVPTPLLWPPGIQFKLFSKAKDNSGRLLMANEMQSVLQDRWALCLDTTLLPGIHDQWTELVYRTGFNEKGKPDEIERAYRKSLTEFPDDPRVLNNLGVAVWRQGGDPTSFFDQALVLDSVNPVLLYNIGVTRYRSDRQEASTNLEKARELDNYSLRIKSAYNRYLQRFGVENGVPVVDLVGGFAGLVEADYFVDHCHPTATGHALIAKMLARQIIADGL